MGHLEIFTQSWPLDKISIDISDNNSYLSLNEVTNDFGDHLEQINVAAFSNFVDVDGCDDSCSEEEPEDELEEVEHSLSESDASEVVNSRELILEERLVVIWAQFGTVVDW